MMRYTAMVQWMTHDSRSQRVTVRGISAFDICAASAIALAPYANNICASISAIWYDWPQPTSRSESMKIKGALR